MSSPGCGGGSPRRTPPAMRDHRPDDREHAGGQQLHRHRRAEPRGDAAERERDADGEQVERAGEQLGADQHRRENPPDPVIGHVIPLFSWPKSRA